MAPKKPGSTSSESTTPSPSKSNIRIHYKNITCNNPACAALVYAHVHREYLIDLNVGLKCRNCGEQIGKAILEDATDKLTPEEVEKFLPKEKS